MVKSSQEVTALRGLRPPRKERMMNYMKFFEEYGKAVVYNFQGQILATYKATSYGNGMAQARNAGIL
jgi:hypothetical protein